jgi:methanogenic corrinoid protein MtbC1
VDILGLCALLTTTEPRLKEVIDALEAEGLREKVKVMVGGAIVTQAFADEIGADGYASNAVEAVALAELLLNK